MGMDGIRVSMGSNKCIQPTYLPSLRYGKSAADAGRWVSVMSEQRAIDKILELFIVSPEEAQKFAKEFIDLVKAHGGEASQQ